MQLLIVESPAKAKKIQSILHTLGYSDFKVVACCGHVRDLAKKTLSIDIDDGFKPNFVPIPGKIDQVSKLCRKANKVWLGSDNDMEGEAISWHLQQVLGLDKNTNRVTFNEITERALRTAISNPQKINMKLVDAQLARRVLDRLVGFKLSPVLWKNTAGLSAGRVQSATLKIICDLEHHIETHTSIPYWTVSADFLVLGIQVEGKLYENTSMCRLESKSDVKYLLSSLTLKPTIVKSTYNTTHSGPPSPFTTSTLQQEHASGVKQTMQTAQALYEHGFITYMRTDCCTISKEALDEIGLYVKDVYGTENHKRQTWDHKKSKGAQEAHEAIRPTDIRITEPDFHGITAAHKKMYQLIWRRTVASQMIESEFAEGVLHVRDKGLKDAMEFVGKLRALKNPGWQLVYGVQVDKARLEEIKKLQGVDKISVHCVCAHNTWSHPPQRYNESGVVKVLESEGIGRPSTYASIIDKLYTKNYVVKQNQKGTEHTADDYVLDVFNRIVKKQPRIIVIGAEHNKLTPTKVGKTVDAFLKQHFDYIVDRAFTATLELELDQVADGERTRLELLTSFWDTFSKRLGPWEEKQTMGWIAREAKYGPVLQHGNTFINLKSYLGETKKGLEDIAQKDIDILTRFPIHRKWGVNIVLGPYGIYLKKHNVNFKMTPSVYKKYGITRIHEITDEEIKDIISQTRSIPKYPLVRPLSFGNVQSH